MCGGFWDENDATNSEKIAGINYLFKTTNIARLTLYSFIVEPFLV